MGEKGGRKDEYIHSDNFSVFLFSSSCVMYFSSIIFLHILSLSIFLTAKHKPKQVSYEYMKL